MRSLLERSTALLVNGDLCVLDACIKSKTPNKNDPIKKRIQSISEETRQPCDTFLLLENEATIEGQSQPPNTVTNSKGYTLQDVTRVGLAYHSDRTAASRDGRGNAILIHAGHQSRS